MLLGTKGELTRQEGRRFAWFSVVLLVGVGLALAVLANSTYQYLRFTQFAERMQGRVINSAFTTAFHTNLAVNVSAALALLACLIFVAARYRYHVRARRWEHDLALARTVQSQLLPARDTGIADVAAVACEFRPAQEVGGDLYDVFPAERDQVAFALGDVAGKGLPAAMLMGLLHGAVRSNLWYRSRQEHEAFADRLNDLLYGRSAEARSASLFWGTFDPAREVLRYVSAGHCPGFVVKNSAGARSEVAARAEIVRLDSSGPVLGLIKLSRYQQVEIPFSAGDVLVLYSDGISEALNERGEEYGEGRLERTLRRCGGLSAAEVRREILWDYRAFLGRAEAQDDVTLLVLEAQGVREEELPQAARAAAEEDTAVVAA